MNTQTSTLTTRKASFWKRLIALVLDTVLLSTFSWLTMVTFEFSDAADYWFSFALFYTYNILMDNYLQSTVGKMMLKIKVIKADGAKPDFQSSFYRNFGKIVSALPLLYGFLRILAPHQRQTIHDELAKCLVIES